MTVKLICALVLALALPLATAISNHRVNAHQHGKRLRRGTVSKDEKAAASAHKRMVVNGTDDDDDGDDDDDDDSHDHVKPIVVANKLAVMAKEEEEKRILRQHVQEDHEHEIARWKNQTKHKADSLEKVKKELASIDTPEDGTDQIDHEVEAVANESQSPTMANFLGDMWKEMRTFAAPFYQQHLKDTVPKLEMDLVKSQRGLQVAELAWAHQKHEWDKADCAQDSDCAKKAEKELEEAKKKEESDAEEDDDDSDDEEKVAVVAPKEVKTAAPPPPPRRATMPKDGKFDPKFTEKTMPGVSVTMHCVISLAFQYFVVYTIYEVIRTCLRVSGNPGRMHVVEKVLDAMRVTVSFAPVLSVLFIGTRQKAIQLTHGDTEKYGLPTAATTMCMQGATSAVTAELIIRLLSKTLARGEGKKSALRVILDMFQVCAVIVLYVCFAVVCVTALTMEAPKELWQNGDAPATSPALKCVIALCTLFFSVYLALHAYPVLYDWDGRDEDRHTILVPKNKAKAILNRGRDAVNIAPMLAVLFLGVRMRATQLDPMDGNPQRWAQACFWLCTSMLTFQVIGLIVVPFCDRESKFMDRGSEDPSTAYLELSNPALRRVYNTIKYVTLFCVYGGATALIFSVVTMEHPDGPEFTPPVAPAVHCIFLLTQLYFFAQTFCFVTRTMGNGAPRRVSEAAEVGVKNVMFAPMLCVLFLGARMRALQLTRTTDGLVPPSAGPQPWAQEGMYLSTWAMFVELIMTYVSTALLGKQSYDDDSLQSRGGVVHTLLVIIKYIALLAMYGGVMIVIVGVFTMTPETLPPYSGYKGLIPGAKVPPPPDTVFF